MCSVNLTTDLCRLGTTSQQEAELRTGLNCYIYLGLQIPKHVVTPFFVTKIQSVGSLHWGPKTVSCRLSFVGCSPGVSWNALS